MDWFLNLFLCLCPPCLARRDGSHIDTDIILGEVSFLRANPAAFVTATLSAAAIIHFRRHPLGATSHGVTTSRISDADHRRRCQQGIIPTTNLTSITTSHPHHLSETTGTGTNTCHPTAAWSRHRWNVIIVESIATAALQGGTYSDHDPPSGCRELGAFKKGPRWAIDRVVWDLGMTRLRETAGKGLASSSVVESLAMANEPVKFPDANEKLFTKKFGCERSKAGRSISPDPNSR